jgi:hypothetical protein
MPQIIREPDGLPVHLLLQVYNSSLTQYCSITISSQSGFPGHIGIFGSGPGSGFDDEQAAQKKTVERIAIRIVFISRKFEG